MNRDEARQRIQERGKEHLQQDGSKKGFICPICRSGSGKNGTGITTKDGIHFTCWAGNCFTNADIIDIIGLENNLEDYNSKLEAAARAFNIIIDNSSTPYQKQPAIEQYTQNNIHNKTYTNTDTPEQEPDYTDFFLQAAKNIEKTTYHRGLTAATLSRFNLGYIEDWRHPKAPNAPSSPRLIIPTSEHSYLARDTRAELTEEQKKYSKQKVGRVVIFNKEALQNAKKPIFIVEGELDALSIIDVGGEAVALGSVANQKAFLKLLESEEWKPTQPLILAMDNDGAGKAAIKELKTGLEELEISFYTLDIAKPHKDANDALRASREQFTKTIKESEQWVTDIEVFEIEFGEQFAPETELELFRREAVAYHLPSFIKDIEQSKQTSFISTGFSNLDGLLDGGLYAGLYIVGAISSLGKTTFCLQIADNIAKKGQDVLIFSLEMARNELISKSISRITYEIAKDKRLAKTTRGILTGKRYETYNNEEKKLIHAAIESYEKYAANIYITEGVGNIGAKEIRNKVENHLRVTGKAPIVIIDYLQIIAPADMRATDKQNTDKAVLELKRLSRDYAIPVIGISSFNRDNYTAPVNLASFKESGAIEYSSDVLIGLQYDGMDFQAGESQQNRDKRIRGSMENSIEAAQNGEAQKIQVKILKHRNGSKGDAYLDFYPKFNYFTEQREAATGNWSKAESTYNH